MTAPKLAEGIRKVSKKPTRGQPIIYEFPDNLITLALLGKLNQRGIDYSVRKDECAEVPNIDALRRVKKSLFGGGFLLSERAAARRARHDPIAPHILLGGDIVRAAAGGDRYADLGNMDRDS